MDSCTSGASCLMVSPLCETSRAETTLLSGFCSDGQCAQSPGQVGDACFDHVDCGMSNELPGVPAQQIYCGSDGICGGKLARCIFSVSGSDGYNEACLSRASAMLLRSRLSDAYQLLHG